MGIKRALGEAFRLAPVRPAISLGLRTALATIVPALITSSGHPTAIFAVTAGFLSTAVDRGGAYRTRARTLLGLTVLSTAALAMGSALGGTSAASGIAATLLVFVWGTVFSMSSAYSDEATSVCSSATTVLLVGLAFPTSSLATLASRLEWMLAGFAWAMLLTLGLWPVRVYRPARMAVAASFDGLAEHVGRMARSAAEHARGSSFADDLLAAHRVIRDSIETARRVLAATRRGRRGEGGRGARLLALVEVVERAFALIIAVTDLAGAGDPSLGSLASGERLHDELGRIAVRLREVARVTRTEGRAPVGLARASLVPPPGAEAVSSLLAQLTRTVEIGMRIAVTLHDDRPIEELDPVGPVRPAARGESSETSPPAPRRRLFEPIRQNLTAQSLVFRHATRVGVTLAIAVALVRALEVRRGYWVTLTVVLLLQPHAPAAFTKILQRVFGTLVGGVLASLVATYVHARVVKLAIVSACAATSTAVLQINYGLYSMFLTPTFVLLAEMGADDPTLSRVRITNTIAGAVLALASTLFLWPSWERDRLPDSVAEALEALAAYVRQIGTIPSGPGILEQVVPDRRALGLALNNADASLARHLNELSSSPKAAAGWMTLVTYSRRFGSALSAWASLRTLPNPPLSREAAAELATRLAAELTAIARSLHARHAAAPPDVPTPSMRPPGRELDPVSERLEQMAFVLAHAAARALGPASASSPQRAAGTGLP